MAIQQRALFALSIAFTASVVAYPDLPAEIPPRFGREGAFVGAPFVAFLLPTAAAVIWWLLAHLDRRPLEAAGPSRRAGAATVLLLSAFHVTMLLAFIGAQTWLGRVLGLMVGVFLIATGNELPRLRPNVVWGIRTPQTFGSDDVWRRVHRLAGHIRVAMGIAVCIAAVSAPRGWAEVIAVAVGLEFVVCVIAAMFFSRQASAVAGTLLLFCCGGAPGARAQGLPIDKVEALPAFIDATVPKLMEQRHVAGTAVAVVHAGQIRFLRGYGKARLDTGTSVDPSTTLFRIGSVTKVFTAAAVLQLVETGRLDPQRDIRTYLPEITLRYGANVHQLLTHTAGLDERFAGAYTDSPEYLQPLSEHLRDYTPPQVFRPGSASSYSNYNYALAGLLVERLSGLTFEEYVADRIFRALKMTATTAHQPPDPKRASDLARGYRWIDGRHEPIPYAFTHASPSGSMTTTAADMGRFMLAMLENGATKGGRILSPQSLQMMLAPQYIPHPRIPGTPYGFGYLVRRGQRLLLRGGTLGDQASLMVLAPSDRFGVFIASNALPGIGDFLFEPLLTHLFGPERPSAPMPPRLPDALQRAPRYAGVYRPYRHARSEMSRFRAMMPMMQSRVVAESDGAIQWQGRRWVEVEPLLFRSVNSPDYMIFRENDRGEITGLGAHERIGWFEQAPFHLSVLASCLIAFLAYLVSRSVRTLRRRGVQPEGRVARACAGFVAAMNLAFVAGLAFVMRDLGSITPFPLPVVLWFSLALASVAVTALLPAFAATAWAEQWWTRRERLAYSTFVVFAVAFMTFLNYWKLLGIRY